MAYTDSSETPPIVGPAARTAAGFDAGAAPSTSPEKVAPRATRVARGTFTFAALAVVLTRSPFPGERRQIHLFETVV